MATFDELIAGLRAEGDFDSEGAFTLSREKAREKMRQFQLAAPRSYVVELVQAAALVGATRIAVEIDADDMEMRFDGRAFARDDFEQLYGAMFSRDHSPLLAARRQLAVGLNGAMGLDPRWARVASGALELKLRPDQPDRIGELASPCEGTEIHVHDRLSGETLRRFVRHFRGQLAEEAHLRERCAHLPLELTINGKPFVRTPPLQGAAGRHEFSEPGVRGVVGFVERAPGEEPLTVLKQGVLITCTRAQGFPPGFAAVFEADAVRKDISQTAVVHDMAWTEALRALKRASWVALRVLGEQAAADRQARALFRHALLHLSSVAELRRYTWAVRRGTAVDPTVAAIAAVKLWPSALEPVGNLHALVSLADVIASASAATGPDVSTRAALERIPWPTERVVPLISDEGERAHLSRVLGRPLHDVTEELGAALQHAQNVARFRARGMQSLLPLPASELVKVPFATAGARGEIGVHVRANAPSMFWFVKDGCLLEARAGSGLLPGFVAALEADFTPSRLHDHVACDRAFVRMMIEVAHAVPQLLSELVVTEPTTASPSRRELALHKLAVPFLGLDFTAGLGRWLAMWKIQDPRALETARTMLDERGAPPQPTLAELLSEDAPQYARAALFATTFGRRVSLAGVAQEIAARGHAVYLERELIDGVLPTKHVVLALDEAELTALRRIFGDQLRDFAADARAHRGRQRHEQQTPLPMAPEERGVADGYFAHDGIEGHVCVLGPEPPATPVQAYVRLLMNRRLLDVIRFQVPIGGIIATVNDDALQPNAHWSGVLDDERLAFVRDSVLRAAAQLIAGLCRPAPRAEFAQRETVLNAAARIYGGGLQNEPWAAELVAALERTPLFYDVHGRGILLAEIREPDRGEPSSTPERLVLQLDPIERELLTTVLGPEYEYAPATAPHILLEQPAASARALQPQARVALDPSTTLARIAFEAPGARGQIGLQRAPDKRQLELRLCHRRRAYAVWNVPAPLALAAVVDDDQLPLNDAGLVDHEHDRTHALAMLVIARVPALIERLLEEGALADPDTEAAALTHLVDYLALESPSTAPRNAAAQALYLRVSRLELFAGIGGKYGFNALQASYARFHEQAHLPYELPGELIDPRRIVLIAGPRERELAARLFPNLRGFAGDWARHQRILEAARTAPPLPRRPDDALESRSGALRGGLQAVLWLPSEPQPVLECAFGARDRLLATQCVSTLFPCAGRVEGEGLPLAAGSLALELDEAQREGLERLAFSLYEQLAKDLYRPRAERALHGARADAARELLQRAARAHDALPDPSQLPADHLAFFAQLGSPPQASAGSFAAAGASEGDREAALLHALRQALRWVADRHADMLHALNLDRIALGDTEPELIASCGPLGVAINPRHPLTQALLAADRHDPVLVAWLASSVYTAMNHFWTEIDDDHEREFQSALLDDVISALQAQQER